METIKNFSAKKENAIFIFALTEDLRSTSTLLELISKNFVRHLIVINYLDSPLPLPCEVSPENISINYLNISTDPMELVEQLKNLNETIWENSIFYDVSCVRTLEMFTIMKFLKLTCSRKQIDIIYSLPFDYNFEKEPFTSYKSYKGDLTLLEPIGFSGFGNFSDEPVELFLFLGFEGAMSLKIVESETYSKVTLVNGLPSFYIKYKDIAVLSNYQTMQTAQPYRMKYVPFDNPYETYNLLDSYITQKQLVCIAPLGTKAICLGICLYALENENVRVVYPISSIYSPQNTDGIYETYIYTITLNE